jgi:hypothetical protein
VVVVGLTLMNELLLGPPMGLVVTPELPMNHW